MEVFPHILDISHVSTCVIVPELLSLLSCSFTLLILHSFVNKIAPDENKKKKHLMQSETERGSELLYELALLLYTSTSELSIMLVASNEHEKSDTTAYPSYSMTNQHSS